MADKPSGDKPKSKKLLIIIVAVLLLVVAGGGGAAFFLLKKKQADAEDGGGESHATAQKSHKPETPPQFLPLDNLVVNLADPGGARFAQIGITLQVADAHVGDSIKAYMPTVRNSILMLVARRTADELLLPEGKEKLQKDILDAVREASGLSGDKGESPIQAVLFSSFIVQ